MNNFSWAVLCFSILGTGLYVMGPNSNKPKAKDFYTFDASKPVKLITADEFEEKVLKSTRPAIVEAYAPWCGYCVRMTPVFKQVAQEMGNDYDFYAINTDSAPNFSSQYSIITIPAILLFKDGHIVDRSGSISTEDLKAKILKNFGQPAITQMPNESESELDINPEDKDDIE